jgi:hypothetical protein
MSNVSQYVPFATGVGNNTVAPAVYSALGAVSTGFTSGVANSSVMNTVWRQSSVASAGLAKFIADTNNANMNDDGNVTSFSAALTTAVAIAGSGLVGAATLAGNNTFTGSNNFTNATQPQHPVTFSQHNAKKPHIYLGTATLTGANYNIVDTTFTTFPETFTVTFGSTNTLGATMSINGIGTLSLRDLTGSSMSVGAIAAGQTLTVVAVGANLRVITQPASSNGSGQTWQNVLTTPGRAQAVTYTNSTTQAIEVVVCFYAYLNADIQVTLNGNIVAPLAGGGGGTYNTQPWWFTVYPGETYRLDATNGLVTPSDWWERRA